ncbi:hypothetical protein [Persephonella atlantica]|uniref:hypothetical protein n=1 Tax=Persephonella atlantica TaxID=2699429 RepID=UPI00190A8904|nr:hypothetical protein [Persephonella atlantica]
MATTTQKQKKKTRKRVPKELIYEMRYGSPIYYRDYDKVLSGEKTLEEVIGSSKLQWMIIYLIFSYLVGKMDLKFYLEDLFGKKVDLIIKEAVKPKLRKYIYSEAVDV